MEANKSIFIVNKTDTEKYETIVRNVLTMLSNRIYIDKAGNKKPLIDSPNVKFTDKGDATIIVKTNNNMMYAIKIVFEIIKSTGKQSSISDFFKEYAQYKKIIIAQDFNNKIEDYMTKQRTQIFKESMFLSNIIDYVDNPKFELLSPTEMQQFKQEYNATDYTTSKMLKTDPIAKYYDLRKRDIVRIIRPSQTSGESVAYRIID